MEECCIGQGRIQSILEQIRVTGWIYKFSYTFVNFARYSIWLWLKSESTDVLGGGLRSLSGLQFKLLYTIIGFECCTFQLGGSSAKCSTFSVSIWQCQCLEKISGNTINRICGQGGGRIRAIVMMLGNEFSESEIVLSQCYMWHLNRTNVWSSHDNIRGRERWKMGSRHSFVSGYWVCQPVCGG